FRGSIYIQTKLETNRIPIHFDHGVFSSSFPELKAGRCKQMFHTRLLQFYDGRNVNKGGELMGVDMFLIDVKICVDMLMPFWDARNLKKGVNCRSDNLETIPASALAIANMLFASVTKPSLWSSLNHLNRFRLRVSGFGIMKASYNEETQCIQRMMITLSIKSGEAIKPSYASGDGRNTSELTQRRKMGPLEIRHGTD
ncbi:hypothetical protein IGI04_029863, partial [Brassica rapa subsp. trilocularis]